MFETYMEDGFGKRYILKRQSDLTCQQTFKPLVFSDESNARQFLNRLRTPTGFWQKNISKLGSLPPGRLDSSILHAERIACQLLCRKQLFIYELDNSAQSNNNASKRSLSKGNGDTYVFTHVSSLLVSQPREVITVRDRAQAKKLLSELNADEKQLNQLAKELNIKTLESSGKEATTEKLVTALVAGEIIINVRKPLASPPPRETESQVTGADKPVALGPDTDTVTVKQAAVDDPISGVNQKSQAETLAKASAAGAPFCEVCEKAKAEKAA